jgi:hypothetical protein
MGIEFTYVKQLQMRINGIIMSGIYNKLFNFLDGQVDGGFNLSRMVPQYLKIKGHQIYPFHVVIWQRTPEETHLQSPRVASEINQPEEHVVNIEGIEGTRLTTTKNLTKYHKTTHSVLDAKKLKCMQ